MAKAKRLEVIATDGDNTARLLWFRIGNMGGIYGSIFHPSFAMHRSYHPDGSVHWKLDGKVRDNAQAGRIFKESGYSKDVDSGPHLRSFTGHFSFLQGGFRLDPDCLEHLLQYEFGNVDRLLIVDSRAIGGEQRHVNFYLDLVEVGSYGALNTRMKKYQYTFTKAKMICEHHCYLEFSPWVLFSLAYSAR